MGFLAKLFGAQLPDLITCIISREDNGTWEADWVDGGFNSIKGQDLDQLIIDADSTVSKLYASAAPDSKAELQYAIYPWKQADRIDAILKIEKSTKDYTANDIQGSSLSVNGRSLEALIATATSKLSDPNAAMLQWVRPIKGL